MPLPPLYKYLDVNGAKLTIGNGRFKHSKSSDFNDTEDLTIQSIFPEDVEVALSKLANNFADVIVQNVDKSPTCSPQLGSKVALIQRVFRENPGAAGIVKEELKKDSVSKIFDVEHMRARSQGHVKEINDFMQGFRVLCVSTHKDSEEMWAEYAENHKGVVLRIRPCIEKDSKFQLFQPVQYQQSRPPLYGDTLEFQAGSLFGDQDRLRWAAMEKVIYAKTLKWKHEGEYRLAIPLREGESWNTLPFHPEEIPELYLGLAMTSEDREDIVIKAKAINPAIEIFQASRGANRALTFEKR